MFLTAARAAQKTARTAAKKRGDGEMKRLIAAAVLALGMAVLCSMRVYAAGGQRILTLPPGGPYRLDTAAIERETGPFEALAVTLAPEGDRAVLFYEGAPLAPYRVLRRAEAERVAVFAADSAAVGVTVLARGEDVLRPPRIRCINPDFSGQTDRGTSPTDQGG